MAEDYALSPHALAQAYLALSAAVTSATATPDGNVHLTKAGRELCVGVHMPIIFEEGVVPVAQHVADVAAAAQRTPTSLPALPPPRLQLAPPQPARRYSPPVESHPSLWMPFPGTREYVTFLQDQLSTCTFKLKASPRDPTFFQWLDSQERG
jgi:hypothetical protein